MELGFKVHDTGIGIAADKIPILFEAFSQVDPSINRKYGGTGLGLAICVRLINMMGGDLKVESEVGKGTTFSFTIQTEANSNAVNAVPQLSLSFIEGKRILVVDDNQTNLTILKIQLDNWKAVPIIASSAPEALDALKESSFDLIITDMQMPEMNGIELATEIRRQNKDIPIILLSSIAEISRSEYNHLFSSILIKPAKQQQLHTVLVNEMQNGNLKLSVPKREGLFNEDFAKDNPYKILVAEDNRINQKLIIRVLNKLGYEPALANNGKEVLEALENNVYDIILMDVHMPEVDGLEATRIIRSNMEIKQPNIIAMTASAMTEDKLLCLDAGMDAYLSKPLNINEIISTLQDVNVSV
jgi:CheY-like chemotaxis protein